MQAYPIFCHLQQVQLCIMISMLFNLRFLKFFDDLKDILSRCNNNSSMCDKFFSFWCSFRSDRWICTWMLLMECIFSCTSADLPLHRIRTIEEQSLKDLEPWGPFFDLHLSISPRSWSLLLAKTNRKTPTFLLKKVCSISTLQVYTNMRSLNPIWG